MGFIKKAGRNFRPKKSAVQFMVDELAKRDYSARQLTEKLRSKGYSGEETESAIEKALEWGYLDDRRVAKNFWRFHYEGRQYSVSRIIQKLREKGFAADAVSEIRSDYDDEVLTERDRLVAERLARAKFGGRLAEAVPEDDQEQEETGKGKNRRPDWQTIAAFLFRRGFSDRVCRQVAVEILQTDG